MPLNHAPKNLVNKRTSGGSPPPYQSGDYRPNSFEKNSKKKRSTSRRSPKGYRRGRRGKLVETKGNKSNRVATPTSVPKGNNAVKAAPLAIKGSGIAAKAKSVALGTVKLGVASVSLWTLAIYGTVEGIFTRRAGITDEERKRAISQYYPGDSAVISTTPPPFEGGQGEGVQYIPSCNWGLGGREQELSGEKIQVGGRTVTGAVKAVNCSTSSYSSSLNRYVIEVVHAANPDGSGEDSYSFSYNASKDFANKPKYVTIIRQDGQPDNDGSLPTEVSTSSRIALQPQPPFPADERIVDDSPIAYNRKPIPQPAKTTDPAPPPDNSEDIQAIKAKLNDIEKRLIDANPGGKEGKSNSAIADKEKAESLEQKITEKNIANVNAKNGLDIGINNSLVDIPAINPTNAIKPVVRSQKYSPEKLDKLKRQRRVEQIELERDADKAERQKKIDKLNNQIGNISGASVLPPPNIDVDKQIDITDGSKTGKEIKNEVTEQKKDEVIQTPKESDAELLGKIGALFTATPLLNKDGFKEAIEEAVCDSSQGGCLKSNVVDPLKTGQNNLTNLLQGFDFGLLTAIDLKLGEGIPGGIGGYLKKAWQSTRTDKMLNLINTTLLIHNASMLSQNIAQTVGDVISNGLEAIGVKDAEGQAINFNEAIGSTITNLITSVVGAENYTSLSTNWAKANRIYQTGVNVLSNVRSIIDATQDIAETAGENVSLIGNALKKSGVVRENSYPWMPEELNTQSRWLNRLDKIQDSVEIFEDITDNARDISEEFKEIKENSEAFKKEIDKKTKVKLEKEDKIKKEINRLPTITEEDNQKNT